MSDLESQPYNPETQNEPVEEVTDTGEDIVEEEVHEAEGEPAEEVYEPNFSYKVLGEERSFDERFKSLIRSKEDEDFVRDLHERADGLAHYKEKFSKKEESFEEVNRKYQELQQQQEELEFLKKTDPNAYFEKVGIDPYKYVQDQIAYEDMTEDEQRRYDEQLAANRRAAELERENAVYKQQIQEQQLQQFNQTFSDVMNRPDVYEVASKVPDFRQQVIEYGKLYYNQHGKDTSIEDAVNVVMSRYQSFIKPQQQHYQAQNAQPNNNQPKRRLPSVGKSSGSSSGKAITSIDDLRKMASEL